MRRLSWPGSFLSGRGLPPAQCEPDPTNECAKQHLERSCCRAPFPAFRAIPVCASLSRRSFAPLAFGGWSPNPQSSRFCSGPGPAHTKTARGPAEFSQGAFSQKPAPSVGIQIVSCELDHIVPAARPVHFSRTFVGNWDAERSRSSCLAA